jgi:hypothetical protein
MVIEPAEGHHQQQREPSLRLDWLFAAAMGNTSMMTSYTDAAIATHACRRPREREREREIFSNHSWFRCTDRFAYQQKGVWPVSGLMFWVVGFLSSAAAFYTGAAEREGHGREKDVARKISRPNVAAHTVPCPHHMLIERWKRRPTYSDTLRWCTENKSASCIIYQTFAAY